MSDVGKKVGKSEEGFIDGLLEGVSVVGDQPKITKTKYKYFENESWHDKIYFHNGYHMNMNVKYDF